MSEHLSRHIVAEWVRAQRTANPVTKLILQLAFDHAGPQEDGRWISWAAYKTLAWEACLADGANGARTVRRHLVDLEKAGIIEREERTRGNGSQTTNRIVLLVPAGWTVPGGRADESGGGGPPSPPQKPQEEAPGGSQKEGSAPASEKKVALPNGFPDELRPHLKATYRVLRDLAERHAAKEVNVCALAQIVMANHRKPLVLAAHECAAHFEGRAPKDVVACYRNWLRRVDALAVVEPLDHEGRTTQIARPGGLRDSGGGDAKSRARMEHSRAQVQRFAERAAQQAASQRLELTA